MPWEQSEAGGILSDTTKKVGTGASFNLSYSSAEKSILNGRDAPARDNKALKEMLVAMQ